MFVFFFSGFIMFFKLTDKSGLRCIFSMCLYIFFFVKLFSYCKKVKNGMNKKKKQMNTNNILDSITSMLLRLQNYFFVISWACVCVCWFLFLNFFFFCLFVFSCEVVALFWYFRYSHGTITLSPSHSRFTHHHLWHWFSFPQQFQLIFLFSRR